MTVNTLTSNNAQEQIDRWNRAHPVPTTVAVAGYDEVKVTRTEAMLLFGRKPVIYLEGHHGYFDLDAVTPVPARPSVAIQSSLCFMLPGQGSQKKGMGASLFDAFPDVVQIADRVLGYSISDLCLNDPNGVLGETQYTQPALYTVNALAYLHSLKEGGVRPAFVLGHSLGEYSALFAADVFDFEVGLRLVQKRGALMAEARGGGMAAVLGMDAAAVRQVLHTRGLDTIDVANINSPLQTVVSGPKDDILRAQADFEAAGARMYIPLSVSGAFHSRYMQASRDEFRAFLDTFDFREPTLTVISNVEARPYDARRTKALLAGQLTSPVRWAESIQYLKEQGVETFREVGPGTVLTALVPQIVKHS